MTKQRPKASAFRVGTRRHGFVVKTRRAAQSAKRIKYWAKETRKPTFGRVKQPRRKVGTKKAMPLHGGSRVAVDFLFDMVNPDSDVYKQYSQELASKPLLFAAITKQARSMLTAFQQKGIKKVLPSEVVVSSEHRQSKDILNDVDQQAHAIVTAHVAFRSRKYQRGYTVYSKDLRGNLLSFHVDLNNDKVWESFQAQTFNFLKVIIIDQKAVQCSSNETFVEAGERFGIKIGSHSGFHHIQA